MGKYSVESGVWGPRLVVGSPWSSEILAVAHQYEIKELELNYAKGWSGGDVAFLEFLPDLMALEITDWTISDVSQINMLTQLRRLKVYTYCKTEINFRQFQCLEECVLEWRVKASSLFDAVELKVLSITHFPGHDLIPMRKMRGLRSLSLLSPKLASLDGISDMTNLIFFGVYGAKKLKSLGGVDALVNLQCLEINGCKGLVNINPLANMARLKEIHLCDGGEIETLLPIQNLAELECFIFYGSTSIVDGNLSVLKELPRLKKVAFQERRHYSHRRADLPGT